MLCYWQEENSISPADETFFGQRDIILVTLATVLSVDIQYLLIKTIFTSL